MRDSNTGAPTDDDRKHGRRRWGQEQREDNGTGETADVAPQEKSGGGGSRTHVLRLIPFKLYTLSYFLTFGYRRLK